MTLEFAHDPMDDKNNIILSLQKRITKLEQGLKDIINPIGKFERSLKPGEKLDGFNAVTLSSNPNYLKSIAKETLGE